MVWAGMAVSNVAARTLQPAIVDIIARRTIDLYGDGCKGRCVVPPPPTSPPEDAPKGPDLACESGDSRKV